MKNYKLFVLLSLTFLSGLASAVGSDDYSWVKHNSEPLTPTKEHLTQGTKVISNKVDKADPIVKGIVGFPTPSNATIINHPTKSGISVTFPSKEQADEFVNITEVKERLGKEEAIIRENVTSFFIHDFVACEVASYPAANWEIEELQKLANEQRRNKAILANARYLEGISASTSL